MRFLTLCAPFLPAFLLFCIGALTDPSVPGIYMDAVNPDYMVVRLLHPAALPSPIYRLPGTMLFGVLPLIGQIYHGALTFYVGLPIYALLGTGIAGIRTANMMFGLLVLAGAGCFMRAFGVRPVICAVCLALLAADPQFLFSFRTQFYITLLPIATIFASAALIQSSGERPGRGKALLAGWLCGTAVYGYFIYAFVAPSVLVLAAGRWRRSPDFRRSALWFAAGLAVGVLPYLIAYAGILVSTGGVSGFRHFMTAQVQGLAPQGSGLSLTERLAFFSALVRRTILDVGPVAMMLHTKLPETFETGKILLLLATPMVALASGLARPGRVAGLALLACMVAGFFLLVLVFGGRLWLHHAAMLLPIAYVALGLTLERAAALLAPARRLPIAMAAVVLAAPFLVSNVLDSETVFTRLRATGGTALSSDAIDRFALATKPGVKVFLPDWGVFMPFVMVTEGRIAYTLYFTPEAARKTLCAGQDALVMLVATTAPATPRLEAWRTELAWSEPETLKYDSRDGHPVLQGLLWRAENRPASPCP